MSLINKLFKGKNTENNAGTQAQQVPEASSQAAADAGCNKTSVDENFLKRIYAFAKANASQANTEKIFGTKEADSYYTDSARVQVFPERIMDFGFDNPVQLEAYLKELWKDDLKMQELIPVIKVATFANRDKYDSKYQDLSLYNYTL